MFIHNSKEKIKLQDAKKNGKEIYWRTKKLDNSRLSASMGRLADVCGFAVGERFAKRAENACLCARYLKYHPTKDGRIKLANAFFCKMPLCPICAGRRSEKVYYQTKQILDHIEQGGDKYQYIMLTLTVRNMVGEELSQALDEMQKGWNRLVRRAKFKKIAKGWYRTLEVNYNWARQDFHPHLHVIIAVKPEYLTDKEDYVLWSEWITLWKGCMRLDYEPSVDIRKVVRGKGKEELEEGEVTLNGAIAEVAKYTTKPADYIAPWDDREARKKLIAHYNEYYKEYGFKIKSRKHSEDLTDSVVRWLDPALHKRRRQGMGGMFKEVHRLLHLDDTEDGDLVHTSDEPTVDEVDKSIHIVFGWNPLRKDYYLYRLYRVVEGVEEELPFSYYEKITINRRARAPT